MEELKHIGNLVTIPYIDCATISMVADYYGVPKALIKGRYEAHKTELDKVGVMTISAKEVEGLFPSDAEFRKTPDRCMINYNFNNGFTVALHTRCNSLFTKEAVDYIGTILTPQPRGGARRKKQIEAPIDSETAPTIRKTPTKFRSDEEKKLCINLAKAFASGDKLKLLSAAVDLDTYRLEQIAELTDKPKNDEETNMLWTSRTSFNKIIKTISEAVNAEKAEIQNRIYYKMIHDYKIPLEERRVMPLIDAVKDSEWHYAYQAIAEVCAEQLLDIRQVFKKSKVNAAGLSILVNIEGV